MLRTPVTRCILFLTTMLAGWTAIAADLYHPEANPDVDLQAALTSAREHHKKVIVQVGGNWCRWTRALDNLYQSDAAINTLIRNHYEFVRVNYSDENYNEEFIAKLGETNGIPFIFILDNEGKLLQAQETGSLELGDGHDPAKVFQLYDRWK
ncbi:MAG: hypothetical protein HW386_2361 [Gammaproteobacteria bacterium]|nr:hypothetical protein [Gammaproteobacteria bacterium]